MGRILAIDYGKKRVGIAVTDELKIIATPLTTVPTKEIFDFLKKYTTENTVELFVIGYAKQLDNTDSESMKYINPFVNRLKKLYKQPIEMVDERFTSKIAFQTMIDGGMKKKQRQDKAMVDKLSACIILQSYMDSKPSF
ncbi:MAG: Holliday junction resolvase RuvX [Marinifilaceae bacterium]|nr:Holliday junction resolvase RuvX [Marinifilaceae bacterium]